MRWILLCFALAGCVAGSQYQPTTIEGAQCKRDCAREMAACVAGACGIAANTCMAACADLDRVRAK